LEYKFKEKQWHLITFYSQNQEQVCHLSKTVLWLRPNKIGKTQQAILDNEKNKKISSFCKSLVASKHCSNDFYHRSFVNN